MLGLSSAGTKFTPHITLAFSLTTSICPSLPFWILLSPKYIPWLDALACCPFLSEDHFILLYLLKRWILLGAMFCGFQVGWVSLRGGIGVQT